MREPALADLIGGATRRAFVSIVDLCLAEKVDALLIAGDLYDGDQTSMKTARFLADQLRRLHEAEIPTFIIRGNHDAESRITRELALPESVKVFSGRADAVTIGAGALDVAIHGVSFAQKHAPESLLPKFREPASGAVNIGMLHTSLGGSPSHDRYAPCTSADLHGTGFAYWALGHVHQRSVDQGRATIVMPGNPQGRDINEAGPRSASLVTIDDSRGIAVEERLTSVAEFRRVGVDLSGADDWRTALKRIEMALEAERMDVGSEHLVARLTLGGATPLAWRLRSDADKLEEEARRIGADLGRTWLDKIELRCVRAARRDARLSRSGRGVAASDGDRGRSVEGVPGRTPGDRGRVARPPAAWLPGRPVRRRRRSVRPGARRLSRARAPRTCSPICARPTRRLRHEDRTARSHALRPFQRLRDRLRPQADRRVRISTSSSGSTRPASRPPPRPFSICSTASESGRPYGAAKGRASVPNWHAYNAMRIGARLELNGAPVEVARLKRDKASLVDKDNLAFDEAALRAELAGVDRDAFRTMFSLDDESLEKGGEEILASRGDLGELLFSASAGLAGLSAGTRCAARAGGTFLQAARQDHRACREEAGARRL